jgi:signal transduction histidine kinase
MVLVSFSLVAIWLDPSEPSRYARLTYGVLECYLLYSLAMTLVTWHRGLIRGSLQVITHGIDLIVFSILMFLTDGPNSPFFVYFIFLLVCSTLRWQWRGTLWSAAVTLSVVITLALFPSNLLHHHDFELNRFIIRIVYLAVVAILLGYLGAHEQSMRTVLAILAEWPRTVSDELQHLTKEMLEYAAPILGVSRILLIWEEDEEPWLHLVLWSPQGWEYSRESPDAFGELVAGHLAGASFFCDNAGAPHPRVMHNAPAGLEEWQGVPLQQRLQERFAVGPVFGSALTGEKMSGYLMALDKTTMTADDLVLGEIIAHEVAARFDNYFLLKQLKQATTADVRVRMARDLHDGLLQSLTGVALQLETAQRLLETEPHRARQLIIEIQRLLASEQSDLRSRIGELRPVLRDLPAEDTGIVERLEKLAERIRLQWEPSVELKIHHPVPWISISMARELYFVVNEALINAVRHSGASAVRAGITFAADRVHIAVSDNGHGFSFRGCFNLDELFAQKRGPVTLKERIAALGGTLSIHSDETGAELAITLPITEQGG